MVAGSLSIHIVRGSCMAHTTTAQCKPELACRLANICTANQVDKRGRQDADVRVRSRRFLGCVANCWASNGGSRTKGTRDECQVRRGACTAADNPRTSTFLEAHTDASATLYHRRPPKRFDQLGGPTKTEGSLVVGPQLRLGRWHKGICYM